MKKSGYTDTSICITPMEAAKLIHVSKGRIYAMIREGKIPHIHNGRRILIVRSLFIKAIVETASEPIEESDDNE